MEVCLYASKPCTEPRAIKDDGTLHRLCEFHRDKANAAQRRWHARQRERLEEFGEQSDDGGGAGRRRRKRPRAQQPEKHAETDALPSREAEPEAAAESPVAAVESSTQLRIDDIDAFVLLDEDLAMLHELVLDVNCVKVDELVHDGELWSSLLTSATELPL